jgi:hypothetical protein
MSQAYRTAIVRKKPSAPAARLAADGMLKGKLLDYGAGRGTDAAAFGMAAYDPHYSPDTSVLAEQYDTITCTYVLCVIADPQERDVVIADLKRLLRPGGIAYITVRRDKDASRGQTSRGTFQGYVELDLPIIYNRPGQYVTYALTKYYQTCASS